MKIQEAHIKTAARQLTDNFTVPCVFLVKATLDPWKFTCLVIVEIRYTKLLIPGWCEETVQI